jgi:hypothetical protein
MAGRIPGMVVLAGRCWPAGRSLETPGLDNVRSLISHNIMGLHARYGDSLKRSNVIEVKML